jgi:sensor histidine kinase YesM
MIIQPLVENAVYHGLSNKQGVGLLSINFTLLENVLEVVVQDDGIGRDAAAKLRQRALKKSASFSTSANLSRIELLNANKQNKIIQTITDLYSSDKKAIGTKVELIIPINDYD